MDFRKEEIKGIVAEIIVVIGYLLLLFAAAILLMR